MSGSGSGLEKIMNTDLVSPERLGPDPVYPEGLDPDPDPDLVNIIPDPIP